MSAKILVVDDEEDMLELVSFRLAVRGHDSQVIAMPARRS